MQPLNDIIRGNERNAQKKPVPASKIQHFVNDKQSKDFNGYF
jgi:hypothetical protein